MKERTLPVFIIAEYNPPADTAPQGWQELHALTPGLFFV